MLTRFFLLLSRCVVASTAIKLGGVVEIGVSKTSRSCCGVSSHLNRSGVVEKYPSYTSSKTAESASIEHDGRVAVTL